jgi:hypothetical protein
MFVFSLFAVFAMGWNDIGFCSRFTVLCFCWQEMRADSGSNNEEEEVPGSVLGTPSRWTPRPAGEVVLRTAIPPQHANHSFNGLLFDVRATGIEDVVLRGVVVGGEIGRYNIYFRSSTWRSGYQRPEGGSTSLFMFFFIFFILFL